MQISLTNFDQKSVYTRIMGSSKRGIATNPSAVQEPGPRKGERVIGRRQLVKRTVTMAAMFPLANWPLRAVAAQQTDGEQATTLTEIRLSRNNKLTIERRGQVALFGINRIDSAEEVALSKLGEQYGTLYHTKDFIEGRAAEAEGRKPVYHGN